MTQLGRVPADVAKTDRSQTWTGTQDFTAATVLGVTGGSGGTVSGATATAAGVVQLAGDLAGPYTAPTVVKLNGATPATVATTGAYADLTGRPALATVATSGAYPDLTGRPALATVATSGAYPDLTGRPALATVATTGAYTDLTGAPAGPVSKALAAEWTNNTAVQSDVTGLKFTAVQPGTYSLTGVLFLSSDSAAQQSEFIWTSTATLTTNGSRVSYGTTTAGAFTTETAGPTIGNAAPTTVTVTGTLLVTAAGDLQLRARFLTGTALLTIWRGAYLTLTKMA